MRRRFRSVAMAVVCTAVSACTGANTAATKSTQGAASPAPATTTTTTGPADPVSTAPRSVGSTGVPSVAPTPWSNALERFDPETNTDPAAALTLYAMAFGPVDGAPSAPDPSVSGVGGDVTIALRAVFGVWDQLSEPQHQQVMAFLEGPTVLRPRRALAADPPLVTAIESAVEQFRSTIAAKIGDFKGTISTIVLNATTGTELASAAPTMTSTGAFTGDCTIRIQPRATTSGTETLLYVIAHEVFHCFQEAAAGSRQAWAGLPGWVVEGGAQWVGVTIATPNDGNALWWNKYLTAEIPLTFQKYEAVGFWSHLDESGTDPWSVFRAVWAAAGTPAAFTASAANNPAFLESWASGLRRDRSLGPAWDTTGPYITSESQKPLTLKVPDRGQVPAQDAAYANGLYLIDATADVLVFTATGTARLADGTIDTTVLAGARFCRRPSGCSCPNLPNDIPPAPLLGKPVLALTGGTTGTSVVVGGVPLELHCEERAKRPVQAVLDRPASEAILAGRVLDLHSCNGPYGDWSGVIRLGGISTADGFEVKFQELPVSFKVGGTGTQTVHTAVAGNVRTPVFDLAVTYDLTIVVDGTTMSISGTATGDTGLLGVQLPTGMGTLPITPITDPAVCPAR